MRLTQEMIMKIPPLKIYPGECSGTTGGVPAKGARDNQTLTVPSGAMENADCHGRIDAKDLSLVADLVLLPKFKTPEFEKYNGTSCPEAHITMFCRRMTGYVNNDQLLIHCLQDSLIESAAKWLTLQNMEKKQNESFRQYTQIWGEVATQVQPPLLEKETTMLFINTLKAPFINHIVGSATKSFSDIVMSGEMIENAVKNSKIDAGESTNRSALRKKKNEINSMGVYNKGYSKQITVGPPKTVTTDFQAPQRQESNQRPNVEKLQFTPISMTYKELYQSLFDAHVVSPFYLKPIQPPYPKWYDTNAQCEYHAGTTGHLIENYTTFKKLVERFIKMGIVKFDDSSSAENPLPNHADKGGLMDNKELEFFEYVKEAEVCASEGGSTKRVCEANHPVLLISRPRSSEAGVQMTPRVIIQKLVAFPYNDSKKVPWNYDCNVTIPGEESPINASEEGREVGFYIRSGKRYAGAEPVKGKTPVAEQKGEKMVRSKSPVKEPVTENEAREFLKFLKHNTSRGHGIHKGLTYHYPLQRVYAARVLIDNRSALNVLPLSTLNRLPIDSSHMKTCQNIVRAFDGTERKVMGRIEIPLLIDPNTYEVDLLVMDINPSYKCLLRRPWIHTAGAVPSSLHQKLKLVAEEDIIAS
ncbi:hypothetical protein EPI10_027374 [Gossypium australe]|uniref:Uncharacterized protein n=1 Tax=Gossypium australe TaxID=47621 RepID=A0A5B6URN9_9ROSI|nr:hypothetical protein EPI10_027374 [Gossypium australe]